MALPIRRATPQPPKTRSNNPSRREVAAPAAGPQPKSTQPFVGGLSNLNNSTKGSRWPKVRVLGLLSRGVVPAPVLGPQPKPTLPLIGGHSNPTDPVISGSFWPKVRVLGLQSRRVNAAPVAPAQPKPTLWQQGVRRGIVKNGPSRQIAPASPPGSSQPPSTSATHGARWPKYRTLLSRLIKAAPALGPQPKATNVRGVSRPTPKNRSSHTFVGQTPPVPPVINVRGVRRGIVKNGPSRRSTGAPLAGPGVPSTNVAGVKRPTPKNGPSRSVKPAASAGPGTPSTNVAGVRRPTPKNRPSHFVVGVAPPLPVVAILTKALRRPIGKPPKPRLVVGAPAAGVQAASIRPLVGAKRTHPKRPPLAHLFVAPVASMTVQYVLGTLVSRTVDAPLVARGTVSSVLSRTGVATLSSRTAIINLLGRKGSSDI